jgi:type 1 fimbria pilin
MLGANENRRWLPRAVSAAIGTVLVVGAPSLFAVADAIPISTAIPISSEVKGQTCLPTFGSDLAVNMPPASLHDIELGHLAGGSDPGRTELNINFSGCAGIPGITVSIPGLQKNGLIYPDKGDNMAIGVAIAFKDEDNRQLGKNTNHYMPMVFHDPPADSAKEEPFDEFAFLRPPKLLDALKLGRDLPVYDRASLKLFAYYMRDPQEKLLVAGKIRAITEVRFVYN